MTSTALPPTEAGSASPGRASAHSASAPAGGIPFEASFGHRLAAKLRYTSPGGLALLAMVVILVIAVVSRPTVLSVPGLTILLTSAVPLVLAVQAQQLIMSLGDVDLGIGYLVGLVTVIAATFLATDPLLGILALVGIVASYALLALVVQLRQVPSIIATLGLSFVWLGLGRMILPTPGGATPEWLGAIDAWRPTWIPAPLAIIAITAAVAFWISHRTRFGTRMRTLGSAPVLLSRAGVSLLRTRVGTYALAAVFAIVAGLLLASQTRSGDVQSANNYTLVTIAAVILGGGSFAGGRSAPIGATFGAITLGLITVLLSFAGISSNLQAAAQGLIVLAVLAGRLITERIMR